MEAGADGVKPPKGELTVEEGKKEGQGVEDSVRLAVQMVMSESVWFGAIQIAEIPCGRAWT